MVRMYSNFALHAILITALAISSNSFYYRPKWRSFPDGFKFGVGSSAYQIEGGWNATGKGENVWDRLFHTKLINNVNGDVACDSYHQYERDIDMIKQLNVSFYRFSLSWSRLFPDGSYNIRNPNGFRYYNALINGLILQGIDPVVTLFHWDLPQPLQNIGGWTNPYIQDYFQDYANECFKAFGDRVKTWLTFNEPHVFCSFLYSSKSPFHDGTNDFSMYECGHNILLAHAKTYHLYNNWFRAQQRGEIGLNLDSGWYEPATYSVQDVMATQRALEFELGWFAHPIFSVEGDYPQIMKYQVGLMSKIYGYPMSRLPVFTTEEINLIRGSADFFGLNHYSSSMVRDNSNHNNPDDPMLNPDMNIFLFPNKAWHEGDVDGFSVNPNGFFKLLIHIMNTYGNPEIRVYENGFPTEDVLDDDDRIKVLNQYLNAMMDAMETGARISVYCFWSLMDNLEWMNGFKARFGLYAVDFDDPRRKTTPKKSATFYKNLASYKVLQQVSSLDMFHRT